MQLKVYVWEGRVQEKFRDFVDWTESILQGFCSSQSWSKRMKGDSHWKTYKKATFQTDSGICKKYQSCTFLSEESFPDSDGRNHEYDGAVILSGVCIVEVEH